MENTKWKEFTTEEDDKLIQLVESAKKYKKGEMWNWVAERMPGRTLRQCRNHYNNCLKLKKPFTEEEDILIIKLTKELGSRGSWKRISEYFNNRTPIQVRNRHKELTKKYLDGNGNFEKDYAHSLGLEQAKQQIQQPIPQTFLQPIPQPIIPTNQQQTRYQMPQLPPQTFSQPIITTNQQQNLSNMHDVELKSNNHNELFNDMLGACTNFDSLESSFDLDFYNEFDL